MDDASPDEAPKVVRDFPSVTLLANESNQGFAITCNHGAAESTGDVLLFLNSDAILTRSGLLRLIESLMKGGVIAAAGPVSNAVGHLQELDVSSPAVPNVHLFADDLALCDYPDSEHDMLVGFCLAVKRSAWEEVGGFDERFAVGMFEDNDLCYRLRRAGYQLVVSRRAFVYHKGNQSLDRHPTSKYKLFAENQRRYEQKWRRDLETGFASHLAGISAARIEFNESRRPERLLAPVKALAERANISLCMIVRDEERVLGECLASAAPFFKQIVAVDTGSTDRTKEIAREYGAEVYEMPWPDSFAIARNESLRRATGDWICWLDADDTLPFASGEMILNAVQNPPKEVGGFIIPVRFVNDDPEFGTVVDHVKVFRNHCGFEFEGRIHEQVLSSMREKGFDVVRIAAEVHHSGYDTSPEGQEKKRARDTKLLELDLRDRPDHPFVLFNLGMTAHFNGEHSEAVDWLQKCIAASNVGESHIRKAYSLWAVSARELGDSREALRIVEEGLASVPDDPELLFHRGILLTREGDLERAAESYERIIQVGQGSYFSSVDRGIFGYKAWHNLGGVYAQMRDFGRAKNSFEQALVSNPRHLYSAYELFNVAVHLGDRQTAKKCFDHVRQAEGDSPAVRRMYTEYLAAFKVWGSYLRRTPFDALVCRTKIQARLKESSSWLIPPI